MSTRGQIIVEGSDVVLYQHCDSYPEGVLPALLPICKEFIKHRGFDSYYLSARITHALIQTANEEHDKRVEDMKKRGQDVTYMPESRCLGFGIEALIDGRLHGDIEFLYIVYKDHVEISKPNSKFHDNWGNNGNAIVANTDLIKSVDFDGNDFVPAEEKELQKV